jgi:Protein of unknown function (DUF2550)
VDSVVVPLWIVAGLAAVLVLLVVVFVVRRLVLARSTGSFDCSVRRGPSDADGGWTSGVASYGTGELRWYRMFSLALKPSCVWRRADLRVREFRPPQREEVFAILPGAVVVTCLLGSAELQLAMSTDAYTGFASWIEAAPPGQHARVT